MSWINKAWNICFISKNIDRWTESKYWKFRQTFYILHNLADIAKPLVSTGFNKISIIGNKINILQSSVLPGNPKKYRPISLTMEIVRKCRLEWGLERPGLFSSTAWTCLLTNCQKIFLPIIHDNLNS